MGTLVLAKSSTREAGGWMQGSITFKKVACCGSHNGCLVELTTQLHQSLATWRVYDVTIV
jgi:hypothetical protein